MLVRVDGCLVGDVVGCSACVNFRHELPVVGLESGRVMAARADGGGVGWVDEFVLALAARGVTDGWVGQQRAWVCGLLAFAQVPVCVWGGCGWLAGRCPGSWCGVVDAGADGAGGVPVLCLRRGAARAAGSGVDGPAGAAAGR